MGTTIDYGSIAEFVATAESADRIAVYVTTINRYFMLSQRELRECTANLEPGERVQWMIEDNGNDGRVTVSLMATTGGASDGK